MAKQHDRKTLIIHDDTAWRNGAAVALEQRDLACAVTGEWHAGTIANATPDTAVVVLQIRTCDPQSATSAIATLRDTLPDRAIIAIVPARKALIMRSVFRAGVWDCLEEPVNITELCDIVAKAINRRSVRHGASTSAHANPGAGADALPEHSAFLDALGTLRSLCRRHGQPLSIMMFDLDRFRDCNERYSPAFGDRVLRWFASTLKGACRRSDIVARYQGDRFIAALPDSRASDATRLALRCAQTMRTDALTTI